ncbi:hypothetical protein M413DRAFT_31169 [Hebeloma cylindrosporum]|uniref:Uncharacterized protein n=1 Tax=Hebeloma cylindrosporum TaxID=76867 RepID=A0A0C3BJS9_HEBCY|nr:hypothetical protein M413DRAFT_31169 [Hebeloma cylindrosporum h7]
MKLLSSLIGVLALGSSAVRATAWVAGYQSSGYTGWNIRQYTDLYVGNPREVAYLSGSNSGTTVGAICNGPWTEWNIITNPNPGQYDFNCIHSVDDINNNARNNGYEIGGINHNGVTVALCYIEYSGSELCDSDTVSNANDRACNVWVVCQN